ncbi:hypothetical protein [Nocardioides sp. KR10-350]|uniref:hypothetical protein n=1 Tax=Nocardioides cheoyonin TaxID=3156615 RepID=UPI0032B56E5F
MTNRFRRRNRRQRSFRVVARGVRRVSPDISRITETTLNHYLKSQTPTARPDVEEGVGRAEEDPDASA